MAGGLDAGCPSTYPTPTPGCRAGRVIGFHTLHYPQGHGPTDFGRWVGADQPYEASAGGAQALPPSRRLARRLPLPCSLHLSRPPPKKHTDRLGRGL